MALSTTRAKSSEINNILNATTYSNKDLTTHSNINMWSKRKPVRVSNISLPYSEVGRANDTWGLVPAGYSWGDGDSTVWTYNKPRGETYNEPYRLGDFRGYNHTAQNPVLLPSAPTELNEIFTVIAIMTNSTDTTLGLSDFWQNMRLGLEVRNETNNIIDWASAASSTGGIDVDLSGYLNTDTISIHFFITDVHKVWGEPSISHTKYSLPRQYTTENKHWLNIPVNKDTSSNNDVERFDVSWFDNELTINVDTVTYTGDAKVTINKLSTGNGVTVATFTIPNTNLYTYTEYNSLLQPSTEYECILSFWNGSSYDYIDTFTFMTFGTV